jgi:NADH:ubiquinone oxidoreductase subunit C
MNTNKTLIDRFALEAYRAEQKGNVVLLEVPCSDIVELCRRLHDDHALSLKTMFAVDMRKEREVFRIVYLFGIPGESEFIAPTIFVRDGESFPSITSTIHEASGYERKIHSFFGLVAEGHPALAQMILHENWPQGSYPLRKDFDWNDRPAEAKGKYEFQKVEGEGIYEIPVGPVHAGIIEPGHFRFSVAGEEIILLEPRLGYKHKGTEKLFERCTAEEGIRLAERVSGDMSFTHALAYCQAVECLAGINVSERASYARDFFGARAIGKSFE